VKGKQPIIKIVSACVERYIFISISSGNVNESSLLGP
jgi:hypothetical protein